MKKVAKCLLSIGAILGIAGQFNTSFGFNHNDGVFNPTAARRCAVTQKISQYVEKTVRNRITKIVEEQVDKTLKKFSKDQIDDLINEITERKIKELIEEKKEVIK